MGLRVTMADGSPADMRAIAVRTVLRVVDGIAFYVVGLIVMLVTGERRQRLGDLAAGTIVTGVDARPAPAMQPAADSQSAFDSQLPESLGSPLAMDAPAPAVEPFPLDLPAVEPVEPASVEPFPVEAMDPVVEPAPELKPFDPFAPADSGPETEAAVEPAAVEPAPAEPMVEAPVMDEPVMDEPVMDEPVMDEPVMEEPVVESPAAPVEEAASTPDWTIPAPQQAPPADEPTAGAAEDSVKVRSVETVSAIDLVMGEVEEDEAAGSAPTA